MEKPIYKCWLHVVSCCHDDSAGQDPSRLRPVRLASDGTGTTRMLLDHLEEVGHQEPRMERGEGVHAQDGASPGGNMSLSVCPKNGGKIFRDH